MLKETPETEVMEHITLVFGFFLLCSEGRKTGEFATLICDKGKIDKSNVVIYNEIIIWMRR